MPREELTQVFVALAIALESIHQSLDSVWYVGGSATIADRARDGSKFANASANAEIIGIDHLSVLLDLFPFKTDVGDPVLPAAIRAAGDIDAKLLLESGNALVQFVGEPASEAFCLSKREFAELSARAGDGGASERSGANRQTSGCQLAGDPDGVAIGNVHDDEILHHGIANVAVAVLVGKIGGKTKLIGRDAAA